MNSLQNWHLCGEPLPAASILNMDEATPVMATLTDSTVHIGDSLARQVYLLQIDALNDLSCARLHLSLPT